MQLTWKNPGFTYSLESIMQFCQEDARDYWIDSLFFFYPGLKKELVQKFSGEKRRAYITEELSKSYEQEKGLFAEKQLAYQSYWEQKKKQVVEAFSEAFELDCGERFEDITGNIILNPICPRYLEEHSFDVFYRNSERGALGVALHEMMHFVWFAVWEEHFKDAKDREYEIPHLKWILSEMVVEPLMRDDRLSSINPYFEPDYEKAARGENGCVYDCFYRMKIEGEPILETLYRMYREEKIQDFMERSYRFCKKHEDEIRRQMEGVL